MPLQKEEEPQLTKQETGLEEEGRGKQTPAVTRRETYQGPAEKQTPQQGGGSSAPPPTRQRHRGARSLLLLPSRGCPGPVPSPSCPFPPFSPRRSPPLGLDSPAAGPADAERGCCPLPPAEEPGAPEPQGLLLSMAGAEAGEAPGGLCSINGRPGGRGAALGGWGWGARRALAEPAGAQAHGPRRGAAGAAQRGLGLLHGDIFSALRSNRGKAAGGRAGSEGLRASRAGGKSHGGSPAGPCPAARRRPQPRCSAPPRPRPRLGRRRCPVMATRRPQLRPHPDGAGPRGARRDLGAARDAGTWRRRAAARGVLGNVGEGSWGETGEKMG